MSERSVPAAGAAALALWLRPLIHVAPQDAEQPLATVWREAELLGVVAAGALSPLGSALLAEDVPALTHALERMLPETSDRAVFGSDLTVLVAGSPSAHITALLDSCADREGRGGATTWRLSPAAVRRALDDGISAAELLDRLAAVSAKELPQPLRYLIEDVARRHGKLRMSAAVNLIQSEDEALLAEVVADRRLAKLALRLLAPTVAGCAVPLDAALARLREVGYFPIPDGELPPRPVPRTDPARRRRAGTDGPTTVLRDLVRRNRPARDAVPPVEPVEPVVPVAPVDVARRLLTDAVLDAPAPRSGKAAALSELARGLTATEVDQLAYAIESGGRVRIEYRSDGGGLSSRVISDPELVNTSLYAWCELRQDERVFTVSRILSVAPAG